MKILKYMVLLIMVIGLVLACKKVADTGQSQTKGKTKRGEVATAVKTDQESIAKGKSLFDSKCSFCHESNSTTTVVGPGLKNILKKTKLPVSKRPATPENIVKQLKNPYKDMPSFSYLTEDEIQNIIAYLNTL